VQIQCRNDGIAICILGLPCVGYLYISSCFISWSTLQRVCTPQTRNCFIFLYKVLATAARDQSCLARPQMTKRQGVTLSYWICTDTSIKSGWVKRLLWANISTLSEIIFSLKIRSELIGHCIYYTIQLSDIDLYRFFSFVLVFWFCFLVCFVCFFLLLFFCFFVFGFIFGINNDKLCKDLSN
jgi:hypothetical protein